MVDTTGGPARTLLSAREQISQTELARLRGSGTLVVDDRRRRPLYFDGRFLAARDLTREQSYFLTRQADLGRAGGAGVVEGLFVAALASGTELQITPGHAITDSGELVMLPAPLTVPVFNLEEVQRLDAAFGLLRRPAEPARNRSGLFIVALRAVEFTANPIASYPTSLSDMRTVEDGDIIEGVVASLIPYPDDGVASDLEVRRARVAREIFVSGGHRGLPTEALPVAMIALDRGVVQWIDDFLVRREVGSQDGDVLGLGFAPRAVREAFLLQYDRHLADVLQQRDQAGRGRRFAASEHFLALPPAGRMPAAAINPLDFTQAFFPPSVDVELSIVPQDELTSLLEDSLLLPPIDLMVSADVLESTSVVVLLPVATHEMRALKASLTQLTLALKPAAPGLVAQRTPLEILQGLRITPPPVPVLSARNLVNSGWGQTLAVAARGNAGLLWYLRRRNLSYKNEVVGVGTTLTGDEFQVEQDFLARLKELGLNTRFARLKTSASSAAIHEIVSFLSADKFTLSKLLLEAALRELEAARTPLKSPTGEPSRGYQLDYATVLSVESRFGEPGLGEGIARLEHDVPEVVTTDRVEKALTGVVAPPPERPGRAQGFVPELDRVVRQLPPDELASFEDQLVNAAKQGGSAAAGALVLGRLSSLKAAATVPLPFRPPGIRPPAVITGPLGGSPPAPAEPGP